jgi:hypothetical protein
MGSNGHWISVFLLLCKLLLRVFSSMLFLLSFYVRIPKGFYPSYPAISVVAIKDNNHQHTFVACSIFSNKVSYQLALPNHSKLHPVFHVSCLKKVIGAKCQIQTNLLELAEEGSIWIQPKAVLDQRECRLCQRTIKEVLVQWKDTNPTDATWEPATILQQFLISRLEDKVVFKGADMLGS